jgi:hypothetical protein
MDPGGRPIRAGEGNRTLTASLEGWSSTIELHPHSRFIVNARSGWSDLNRRPRAPKARALPSCATARFGDRVIRHPFLSQTIRMVVTWNSRELSSGG